MSQQEPGLKPLEIRYESLGGNSRRGLSVNPASGQLFDSILGKEWKGVVALRAEEIPTAATDARHALPIPTDRFFDLATKNFALFKAALQPQSNLEQELRLNEKLRNRLQSIQLGRLADAENDPAIPTDALELKVAEMRKEYDDLRTEPMAAETEALTRRIDELSTIIHQKQLQNIAMRQDIPRLQKDTSFAITQSKSEALIQPLQRQIDDLTAQLARYKRGVDYLDKLEFQTSIYRNNATENLKIREKVLATSKYLPPSLVPETVVDIGANETAFSLRSKQNAMALRQRELDIDHTIAAAVANQAEAYVREVVHTVSNPPVHVHAAHRGVSDSSIRQNMSAMEFLASQQTDAIGEVALVYLTADRLMTPELRYQTNLAVLLGNQNAEPNLYDTSIVAPYLEVIRSGPETLYTDLQYPVRVIPAVFIGLPSIRETDHAAFMTTGLGQLVKFLIWNTDQFDQYRFGLPGQQRQAEARARTVDTLVVDASMLEARGMFSDAQTIETFATNFAATIGQGDARRIVFCFKNKTPRNMANFNDVAAPPPFVVRAGEEDLLDYDAQRLRHYERRQQQLPILP